VVDGYGHDYLKQMCADIGYAVVPDIESLPSGSRRSTGS